MRVILLNTVNNLGKIGEEVNVSSGYARNFLIPNSQAILATKKNVELFKMRHVSLEKNLIKIRSEAEFYISLIKKIEFLVIFSKSGVSGKLFGSIGVREIADGIKKLGVKISKYNIHLPNGKIRYLGDHSVVIKFHREVFTILNVRVVSSDKTES